MGELIKVAQERGEFDNLPGKGKPIDLSDYFETPEEVRLVQSVLKHAGMTHARSDPPEGNCQVPAGAGCCDR